MARLLAATALLLLLTASPALARDRDRLPDRWEKRYGLNLEKNDADRDRDRDGLSNYGEYRSRTNPRKKDTDRDGRRDAREDRDRDKVANAVELRFRFDPRDRDSDDDGIRDGRENAGTLTRVSASSVTIRLATRGTLTAALGEDFGVGCSGGSAPAGDDTPSEPSENGDDETGEDLPAEDSSDEEELGDVPDAAAAQEETEEAEPELDDEAFDREFDAEFGAGEECGIGSLRTGALVREATVDRSSGSPVLVALELLR